MIRDSWVLSGLAVGEQQQPRLGGCVRVFFQLFDWNRRLASKKRIFTRKQLPSERPVRRPFVEFKEGRGENEHAKQEFLIENGEEADNLKSKDDRRCEEKTIIEEDGIQQESTDGGMQETVAVSAGYGREKECSNSESGLQLKSPGVIARLMGLESVPSSADTQKSSLRLSESRQKGHHIQYTEPPPNAPQDVCVQLKVHPEHGLPDDELNALLEELNGTMSTILSALPPRTVPSSSAGPVEYLTYADMGSSPRIQDKLTARQANSKKTSFLRGAKLVCETDDISEFEQQMTRCPKAEGEPTVRTIKGGKRVKGKSSPNCVGGKTVCVNDGTDSTSTDMDVQYCRTDTRKKLDASSPRKVAEAAAEESRQPSGRHRPAVPCRKLEDKCKFRKPPNDLQATNPHRKSAAENVRGSPIDQSSCGLASSTAAASCKKPHFPSTDFGKKPREDNADFGKAVGDRDQTRSLDYIKPASNSTAAVKNQEAVSLIRLLMKRRAAREAAAAAALQAAGILRTAIPVLLDMPAVSSPSTAESLQRLARSCNNELRNDPNRREKLSAGRSEAGGVDLTNVMQPLTESAAASCDQYVQEQGVIRDKNGRKLGQRRSKTEGLGDGAVLQRLELCRRSETPGCVDAPTAGGSEAQEMVCKTQVASGKNRTAAILQDVISALSTPASSCRPYLHNGNQQHQHCHFDDDDDDDDADTPPTTDGHDTESTSSGGCWAPASQPSPVSVLVLPFDDDVSTGGGGEDCSYWIQTEEEYVAALLASIAENGRTARPASVDLFGKLEERVVAAWPDSEVPSTPGYRRLIFDCVGEAVGEAMAWRECRDKERWWAARAGLEEMRRWRRRRQEDQTVDDMVGEDLQKACSNRRRRLAMEVQSREIARVVDCTIFDLLVEELVCDLVLA